VIQHNTGNEIATIDSHQSAVATLVDQAKTHRIVDDFTRGQAADLRNALKTAERRVDDARTSRAEEARLAAEKTQREAAAAGMTKADAAELADLVKQDVIAQPAPAILQVAPPPPPPRTIASTSGAVASVKRLWDFELKDVGALATAYPKTVDVRRGAVLDLLRDLERDGATEAALENAIPGIRAFKSERVSG